MRYAEFVVPLVKAVQEQQQIIELLQQQNTELLKRLETLENKQTTKNSQLPKDRIFDDAQPLSVRKFWNS